MATTRIKEKLSRLVSSQLPEFIQADYPTFIAFIKAYYEFLEQDQNAQELLQNARSYNDIDTTVDSFVQYFIRQYYDALPKDIQVNKKALVKRVNDLYSSKGSENSYKLLFRLLFNKEVNISYPSLQILKASDGKWLQRNSVYIQTVSGNPDDIQYSKVVIKNVNYETEAEFFDRQPVIEINAQNIYGVSTDKSEFFFNNVTNPSISIGDYVYAKGFTGIVLPSFGNVSILDGGSNFRVGDIINVEIQRGTGAKLKVVRTGSGGSIQNVQIISFGVNYPEKFFYNYTKQVATQTVSFFDYIAPNITIRDGISSIEDNGTIIKNDYSLDAFVGSYVGELLSIFKYTEGAYTSVAGDVDAIFSVGQSVKNFYPGFFTSNDGFISDDIYLESEDVYQPYVYKLSIDEQLEKYKKVVLDILHPAGKKLNADYTQDVRISFYQQVRSTLNFIVNDYYDLVAATDSLTYSLSTTLTTVNNVIDQAFVTLGRTLYSNTSTITDNANIVFNKVNTSFAAPLDSNIAFSSSLVIKVPTYSYEYFFEDYTEADGNDGATLADTVNVVKTP